jgi:signal transduction histidine kinase
MSHDLRTPLNAVLGFAQLLATDRMSDEQLECVRQILKGGEHLLDLINEVLDIARIEAGHLSLSPEPVEVLEIVSHAASLVAPLARQRQILVTVSESALARISVVADRQRLVQILLNLLSNAVKYNRDMGTVSIGFERSSDSMLRINVTDTGTGISPQKLRLLFRPFERLGAETTAIEGTGLGSRCPADWPKRWAAVSASSAGRAAVRRSGSSCARSTSCRSIARIWPARAPSNIGLDVRPRCSTSKTTCTTSG